MNAQQSEEDQAPVLPSLPRIKKALSALTEAWQQYCIGSAKLPTPKNRQVVSAVDTRTANPVVGRHFPSFRNAWSGFASARMVVYPETAAEASTLIVAERCELEAWFRRQAPPDNSLPPRPVGISLVVPPAATTQTTSFDILDGFATISDRKTSSGVVPITTQARFTAYVGEAAGAIHACISSGESIASGGLDKSSTIIVVRWAAQDYTKQAGELMIRTEHIRIHGGTKDNPTENVQQHLMRLARSHSIELPPAIYSTPVAPLPCAAERQMVACNKEFLRILERTLPFQPTHSMLETGCSVLTTVDGVFIRLVPKKQKGIPPPDPLSSEIVHAVLLCAAGVEKEAYAYVMDCVKTASGQLVMPDATRASRLLLHLVFTRTENICLNGMVSLFSIGGRPGAPISSPNTQLRTWTTYIMQIEDQRITSSFDLAICDAQSVMPEEEFLVPFMERNMQRNMEFWRCSIEKGFRVPFFMRMQLPTPTQESLDPTIKGATERCTDDQFILASLGIHLSCPRTLIGEAISIVREHKAPSVVVDVLTKVALQYGFAISLSEAFSHFADAFEKEEEVLKKQQDEVKRLRKIIDAAMLVTSLKRPSMYAFVTPAKKVRQILEIHSLSPGAAVRVDRLDVIPREDAVARSLAVATYSAYNRGKSGERFHIEELKTPLANHHDIVVGLCRALRVCMVHPGTEKECFIISHANMKNIAVFAVERSGLPAMCGIGRAFEAESPCLLLLQYKGEGLVVTPMLKK